MSANTNWLLAEFIERSDEPSMSRGIGAAAAAASKRRGLVVGVNEYKSSTIPDLRGAEPDAAAYFQMLVSRGGFAAPDVVALKGEDATLANVQAKLNDMLGDAPDFDPTAAAAAPPPAHDRSSVDVLAVVFCGHGTSQPDKTKPSGESQSLVLHDSAWDTPSKLLTRGLRDVWLKAQAAYRITTWRARMVGSLD